jgi:type I restriction enzyme S subunit
VTLPPGWTHAQIGDLCDLINGRAFKPKDWSTSGLPIIRIQNLNNPDASFNFCDFDVEGRFLVDPGELLFAWSGTPGTSFGAHIWNGPKAVLNQHIFRVRFDEDQLDKSYFRRAINAKLDELIGKAHGGVGLAHVTKGKFEATEIALPPLAEQRRIVAKLEALTARLARARAELERVPVLAKHLREVALTSARAEAASAPCVPVSEIATITFDGPFGSNLKSADYVDEGVRVVRLENIGHLRFIGDKVTFISPEKYEGLKRHTLAPGDILFSSFVDREVRVCLFPDDLGHIAINKADCFAVRPDLALCDPHYVTFLLASAETYEAMKGNVRGVTRPRIGLSQLRNYEIPLPLVQEQKRIADSIKATFARADRLEAEASRARALLDRLESALLAKAFRGELVPQDPNDEPAQTLLDRIRTQRAAAPKAKRGRKAKVTA